MNEPTIEEQIEFVEGEIRSKESTQGFYFRYDTEIKLNILKAILKNLLPFK